MKSLSRVGIVSRLFMCTPLVLVACSAGSNGERGGDFGGGGSGGTLEVPSSTGSLLPGSTSTSDGVGGSLTLPGQGGDDGAGGKKCGGVTVSGEPVPLDIFLMLDKSGSMADKT